MSIGEFISLYEDNEINLEPAFQRLFRWDSFQETNFIESILLGYPIPAIFVLQTEKGTWDVIDGVQRLSTIYHFTGKLKEEEPLILESVKILKNLEGKTWDKKSDDSNPIDTATKIDFKRAYLPVIVLKADSDPKAKYELFKRLNTGGSHLTSQEVRNALILMLDEDCYKKLEDYTKNDIFKSLIVISENKLATRMDMEILIRFIFIHYKKESILSIQAKSTEPINNIIDNEISNIITDDLFDIDYELNKFDKLINYLYDNLSEEYSFKVYDNNKEKFKGAFSWFVFEVVIWGFSLLESEEILNDDSFANKIKEIKSTGEYYEYAGKPNLKSFGRIKETYKYAKEVFDIE
jgi:hypothetical protein